MVIAIATEIAWCAGFFDGEGSCCLRRYKNQGCGISLQIKQTKGPDLLDRVQSILGGKVYGPYQQKNRNHSEYWDWRLDSYYSVANAYNLLYDYLGDVKRSQIESKLQEFRDVKGEISW